MSKKRKVCKPWHAWGDLRKLRGYSQETAVPEKNAGKLAVAAKKIAVSILKKARK
jgi:hypothetical protein